MKEFFKKKFNSHSFDIKKDNDNLIFKLTNQAPLSKSFLILKNNKNKQRIIKEIKNSKASLKITDLSELGTGVYDVYLKTKVVNKEFLKRTPFKIKHNVFLYDEANHLKLQTENIKGKLSLRLKNFKLISDDKINIFKVEDDNIDELVYNERDYKYNLSAIVLVYNGEPYLRDCLKSLINQSLDDLEIILINDKSSDDSLEICKEFAQNHDNIKIIDKQKNHGLATSANMGIQIAGGEYIILVDNDDIIPPDAYEKLYKKAKSCDADISIGQANLLFDDRQNEMYDAERKVLEEEKVIKNISDFPELFHDAFYWNKIIKKDLICKNNIKLPEGMIYADRKFAHLCFIHADTISIIPECVYMWRIRLDDEHESLSRKRNETSNYINRIESYSQDLDILCDAYSEYFKILMRRVIIPVKGIINNPEFEEAFYKYGVGLLKKQCQKLDNIYDNNFTNWDNIIIFLALNDLKDEIHEMINLNLTTQRSIVDKNEKNFWNLPLFNSGKVPEDLFEIKSMIAQFLSIDYIRITDDKITFKGIRIPKYLDCERCEINFIGKTDYTDVLANNTLTYDVLDGEIKIKSRDLADFEVYDIFFKIYYSDKLSDNFRIEKHCIGEIKNNSDNIKTALTKYGNLSITSQRLNSTFKISADSEALKVNVKKSVVLKQELIILLENNKTHEKAQFVLNGSEYVLKWKYFYDAKSKYSFKISLFDDKLRRKHINLNQKYLNEFAPIEINNVKIDKDKNGNINLS